MMSFDQIMEGMETLALRNGFYACLYDKINQMDEQQLDMLKASWEGAFADMVDFVMWIER